MVSSEQLRERWQRFSAQVGGYSRIDAIHPLELYIGYDSLTHQQTLLLISDVDPGQVPSSKSIHVGGGKRLDGRWAVTFSLIRDEQEEVFLQLCCDLIESSRSAGRSGATFLLERYRRWHKLMQHEGSQLLSQAARKGLVGELIFLQRIINSGISAFDAVSGWVGQEGADRDFVFPWGWHEIKTVGSSAMTVTISSLQQLDAPSPGELVVLHVDLGAPGETGGFSLNEKVNELEALLRTTPAALDLFSDKLFFDRMYLPLSEYDHQRYRMKGLSRYSVDDNFPRLTVKTVPTQIPAANYELSLAAIEPWKVE